MVPVELLYTYITYIPKANFILIEKNDFLVCIGAFVNVELGHLWYKGSKERGEVTLVLC